MMSKERRTLLITTFICLCSLLVYISFTAVYPEPKTVQQNLYSNMLFVGGIVINVVLNIVLNFKVCKTMGAKFPWLLNDEESWDKTHKLASYTWILAGIIFILQLFVSPLKVVSIPLVIILVGVLPLIYSLMLVYKNKRR